MKLSELNDQSKILNKQIFAKLTNNPEIKLELKIKATERDLVFNDISEETKTLVIPMKEVKNFEQEISISISEKGRVLKKKIAQIKIFVKIEAS